MTNLSRVTITKHNHVQIPIIMETKIADKLMDSLSLQTNGFVSFKGAEGGGLSIPVSELNNIVVQNIIDEPISDEKIIE